MDARIHSSSARRHTVVALTVFAFLSFLFMVVQDSENQSFVRYDRRDVLLVARQGRPTTSGTSSAGVSATTSSSVPFEIASPSPSPSSSSSSTSLSLAVPTSIPPTMLSSFSSVSSSPGVSQTHTASTASLSSTQSAQTLTLSSVSREKLLTSSPATVRFTESVDRAPATTLAITNNFMPTFTRPSPEPVSSSPALPTVTPVSDATTSSFWHKKGAVAAIFVIVALVVLAIAAILVVTFLKRRIARREAQLHDELFENTESERRSLSPSASITAVPLDPFATREVRYDTAPLFSNYAIPQVRPGMHSTSPVQHPDHYNQTPSRYLAPSHAQAARSAAPASAFRNPDARDSYQPSFDSFYGAG